MSTFFAALTASSHVTASDARQSRHLDDSWVRPTEQFLVTRANNASGLPEDDTSRSGPITTVGTETAEFGPSLRFVQSALRETRDDSQSKKFLFSFNFWLIVAAAAAVLAAIIIAAAICSRNKHSNSVPTDVESAPEPPVDETTDIFFGLTAERTHEMSVDFRNPIDCSDAPSDIPESIMMQQQSDALVSDASELL